MIQLAGPPLTPLSAGPSTPDVRSPLGERAAPPGGALGPDGEEPLKLNDLRHIAWDIRGFAGCEVNGLPYAVADREDWSQGRRRVRLVVLRLDFQMARGVKSIYQLDREFDNFGALSATGYNDSIFILFNDCRRLWYFLFTPSTCKLKELTFCPRSPNFPGLSPADFYRLFGYPISPGFPTLPGIPFAYIITQCSNTEIFVKVGGTICLLDIPSRTAQFGGRFNHVLTGSAFARMPAGDPRSIVLVDGTCSLPNGPFAPLPLQMHAFYAYPNLRNGRDGLWLNFKAVSTQDSGAARLGTPGLQGMGACCVLSRYILLVGGESPGGGPSGGNLYLIDTENKKRSKVTHQTGVGLPPLAAGPADLQRLRAEEVAALPFEPERRPHGQGGACFTASNPRYYDQLERQRREGERREEGQEEGAPIERPDAAARHSSAPAGGPGPARPRPRRAGRAAEPDSAARPAPGPGPEKNSFKPPAPRRPDQRVSRRHGAPAAPRDGFLGNPVGNAPWGPPGDPLSDTFADIPGYDGGPERDGDPGPDPALDPAFAPAPASDPAPAVGPLQRLSPFVFCDEACLQSSEPAVYIAGGGDLAGHNATTVLRIPLTSLGRAIADQALRTEFLEAVMELHERLGLRPDPRALVPREAPEPAQPF